MVHLFSMVSFFAYTRPIRLGVGAIDNPDQFKQVFDPCYILEVPEKIFTHDISMVRRQKMLIFGVLTRGCGIRCLVAFLKNTP